MDTPRALSNLTDRLMARLKPQPKEQSKPSRREPRITEDAQFLAMMWRMVRALEARSIERPENLLQVLALVQRFEEIVNVTIATNAERYHRDPRLGASMKECARIMGISAPSASKRKALGEKIIGRRLGALGIVRIDKLGRKRTISGETAREQAAIAAAAEAAVVPLADYFARRAA